MSEQQMEPAEKLEVWTNVPNMEEYVRFCRLLDLCVVVECVQEYFPYCKEHKRK